MTRKNKVRSAITVIFLLACTVAWWYSQQPSQNEMLYLRYFKPDPGLATTMGTSEQYQFDKAMIEYKKANFEAAAALFEQVQAARPDNDTLNYFTGIALLSDHGGGRCVPFFDRALAVSNSLFTTDAYWYKGLALLRQNNVTAAKLAIRQSGHESAAELLKQLE